jgi:UDP:flavonoid glycosyltransferase YjiC (YdhE family)
MSYTMLFFSRGRGRGHAIPDLAIAQALQTLAPEVKIVFASYATGAETFRKCGREVVDMALPESNSYLPTLLACDALIRRITPDIIVSHEEFAAIVAARLSNRPGIFLSAWLPNSPGIIADSLAYADALIILEEPGVFSSPGTLQVEPRFVGHLQRELKYTKEDRLRAREELALPASATVITVVSSGFATEDKAPILATVTEAFGALAVAEKRLVWVAGSDSRLVAQKTAALAGVRVVEYHSPIEQLLAASDVVITKGTRGITLEAASLAVPSISLSHGLNPVDDLLVPRVPSNLSLNARAVTGRILAEYISRLLEAPDIPSSIARRTDAATIARMLLDETARLCHARTF